MKFFAFLLICVGICNAVENLCHDDYFKKVQEKCIAAHGGDRELIEDFLYMRKPTSDNGKCYAACIMQECKYMDESGNLNPNTYKSDLNLFSHGDGVQQNLMAKDFEECLKATKVDENKCTTAANYMDCLVIHCQDCKWDFHGI